MRIYGPAVTASPDGCPAGCPACPLGCWSPAVGTPGCPMTSTRPTRSQRSRGQAVHAAGQSARRPAAKLADQEITQLLRRASDDLALDVLGLLTATRGGPLAAADLARADWQPAVEGARGPRRGGWRGPCSRSDRQTRRATPSPTRRCSPAASSKASLTPAMPRRIDEWAATWRDRGWPAAHDGTQGTPLYLLDRYPQTLYGDPPRLAALAGDVGWVTAAIRTLGVDAVLAELKTAGTAAPGEPRLAAMHAAVRGQAHHLRDPEAADDPGFVPRQLCLQAAELGETLLAVDCRTRLLACDDPGPVLQWTTRRASPALILELGRHDGGVGAVAVLPDGRVVTVGDGVVGGGYWCGIRRSRAPARSSSAAPSGGVGGGGGAAGRASGHRRRRRLGADAGVGSGAAGRRPGRVRPLTSGGVGRWRCCRTGEWSPGASSTGGCWCGTRPSRAPARSSSAATRTAVGAVAVLPDGRVVTGGDGVGGAGTGVGSGAAGRRPGRARPRRGRGGGGGGAAGRAGGHRRQRLRRRRRAGAGVGPGRAGRRPGRARPRRRTRWGRWRCCRTGGWSPAATVTAAAGCWCGTRPSRAPARPSSATTRLGWGRWRRCRTGGWSPAATATGAGAGVGPGCGAARPGRGRPRRGRSESGGGAAGRAGGHRGLRRRAGAGVGPGRAGAGPVELGRDESGVGQWRCCRTGGWSPAAAASATTACGCWCGTRPSRARARPSSAAPRLGWGRWRRCRTGGWSPASSTGGCWCGTRPSRAPARSSSAATRAR